MSAAAAAFCVCYVTNDSVSWYRRAERHLRADNAHHRAGTSPAVLASLWCQAGAPALVACDFSWHPHQCHRRANRRHCAGYFNETVFGHRVNIQSEIYRLQPLFPLQYQRRTTKKWHLFRQSEKWIHRGKLVLSALTPILNTKWKFQCHPSWAFCFIFRESISTQCSSFLPGSLDSVLGVVSLMLSTFV